MFVWYKRLIKTPTFLLLWCIYLAFKIKIKTAGFLHSIIQANQVRFVNKILILFSFEKKEKPRKLRWKTHTNIKIVYIYFLIYRYYFIPEIKKIYKYKYDCCCRFVRSFVRSFDLIFSFRLMYRLTTKNNTQLLRLFFFYY